MHVGGAPDLGRIVHVEPTVHHGACLSCIDVANSEDRCSRRALGGGSWRHVHVRVRPAPGDGCDVTYVIYTVFAPLRTNELCARAPQGTALGGVVLAHASRHVLQKR